MFLLQLLLNLVYNSWTKLVKWRRQIQMNTTYFCKIKHLVVVLQNSLINYNLNAKKKNQKLVSNSAKIELKINCSWAHYDVIGSIEIADTWLNMGLPQINYPLERLILLNSMLCLSLSQFNDTFFTAVKLAGVVM